MHLSEKSKRTKDEKGRKQILPNELLFRKLICRRDYQGHPGLYKVNCMSETEMKINLGILLAGDHEEDSNEDVEFPDESAILSLLDHDAESSDGEKENENITTKQTSIPLNEPCAVVWDPPRGREWYIGMTRSIIDEESYTIEYLERHTSDSTKKLWRYP